MGYVYVVQNPMRWDPDEGKATPRYNLEAAERFGRLRLLISETTALRKPAEAIAKMKMKLAGFNDGDYLLLIGNPALIGYATALAAASNSGRVRLLIWSGREKDYSVVESHLPLLADEDKAEHGHG